MTVDSGLIERSLLAISDGWFVPGKACIAMRRCCFRHLRRCPLVRPGGASRMLLEELILLVKVGDEPPVLPTSSEGSDRAWEDVPVQAACAAFTLLRRCDGPWE